MNRSVLTVLLCISILLPIHAKADEVVNELYFTADLTDIYGSGLGFFDPAVNTMNLMGLDWVGAVVLEDESERRFEEDPFNPGIFMAIMVIEGQEGDSTKWKCKAEPGGNFFNDGWEISPDYWYTIQEHGHVEDIEFKPNIYPIQSALDEAVSILFQVDMTQAANFYTQEVIDPATVEWVGLKGQNSALGAWAGNWLPTDTLGTDKTLHVLRDDGQNGDKLAGDFIFSAQVEFPAGNEGGPGLFKYGAYYSGALEANGGESPLDNEMHGTDHWINIKVGGQPEILNRFGVIEAVTGVEDREAIKPDDIRLLQNYPNPFNPSTTLVYNLHKPASVDLSVYNLKGQKVATLVKQLQQQGKYSETFNATSLPSGVYVFRLQTEEFCVMKKVILVK